MIIFSYSYKFQTIITPCPQVAPTENMTIGNLKTILP